MIRSLNEKIITPDRLSELIRQLKGENKKVISTNGCFDILHRGHVTYLAQARARAPDARVWAVVKANAYGHGIERVYEGLRGADGFALLDLAEAERVLYVLTRIQQSGYSRHDGPDGDVRATALVNERQEWRWLITAGNHRASAAAALGMPSIPVRVNLVISRADAPYWKHVVDGLYSLDDALAVFDNFFDGRPVGSTRPWLERQGST